MEAIVYGKNRCIWCDRAKNLLDEHEIPYEYKNIEENTIYREELFNTLPSIKTVPQIFIDNEYIGGFEALNEKSKTWQNE